MQVDVFVTQLNGALRNSMLIVPVSMPPSMPPRYGEGWRYFCTVHSRDAMFGGADVDAQLNARGFAMVRNLANEVHAHAHA